MPASRIFERIVAAVARRPLAVTAAVAVLALAGGLLALRLAPSVGTDTLVSRGSPVFKATDEYHRRFGDDAVLILVRGPLPNLVLTSDIERLLGLEGCISGNVPAGAQPIDGPSSPCGQFASSNPRPVQVVYGPGTFLNEAVRQIQEQFSAQQRDEATRERTAATAAATLAAAQGRSKADQRRVAAEARQLVRAQFLRTELQLALTYGIRSVPRLNDPAFVSTVVFDPARGANVPKARFAYLFPNSTSALVQVRLRPGLSDGQRRRAIGLIEQATTMKRFKLANGGRYTVTGAPVVLAGLTTSITDSIVVLLLAALAVMALTLALVFRTRLRLLPLAVALAAAGLTFGGMELAGATLTMASIAVLPVLIGLGVDYAIQFQSRFDEQRARAPGSAADAARRAAAVGAPTIATAGLATATGFLVLLLSPVPMVRDFGLLLVIGIVVAFGCALTAGFGAMVLGATPVRGVPVVLERAGAALASSWRGMCELLGAVVDPRPLDARLRAIGRGAHEAVTEGARYATRQPTRVVAIGAALAILGLAVDTQTRVVSDVQRLVPGNLQALRDLSTLQRSTSVSGEIDVTVAAADLTEPSVVNWMTGYQQRLLNRYGYTPQRGCGKAKLCPALSLPDLFRSGNAASSRDRIRALLDAVPPYFSQAVISGDRTVATMAFGIRLMPLDQQQAVIDEMRRQLHPPSGVTARVVGLPVLAAQANRDVSAHWRRLLTLVVGLAAVALVLLGVFRRVERALVPLVPIALASGWSALVLFAIRVPLNPMSVTLGALVIAISTEFSVLLAERYRQERAAGYAVDEALVRTYRSTGAAVLASGLTAIAGFAVLVVSDIRMLREFGFVTVVDLLVSLVGVMVVLPAVLVLAERGELTGLPAQAWRWTLDAGGRARHELARRRRPRTAT